MQDIRESATRPQTPFDNPPPSPPASPSPASPVPPGFDDTPNNSGRNSPSDDNDDNDYPPCQLPEMATSVDFIRMVREATLDSQFSVEELAVLHDPQEHDSVPEDDRYLKHSIQNFIDLLGCAQDRYTAVRQNLHELDPDIPMLSYDQVKRRVRNLSGIATWEHHMCVDSCVGFTGPFADLESCPRCGKSRYDQKKLEESGGILKVP